MFRLTGLLVIAMLAVAAGPAVAQGTAAPVGALVQTDSAAIHEVARRFSAAYLRGDAAAIAELYTPDGAIFPEQSPALTGREAIRRYFTLGPGRRITRHVITPTRVEIAGDVAYDYGVYEIAGTRDGNAWGPHRGKYVIVWRRDGDGVWRMHLDIWNSIAAPAD